MHLCTRPNAIVHHVVHGTKTCLQGFRFNTGADQPVHPRSLIGAYVIHFLESIIIYYVNLQQVEFQFSS